MCGICGFVGHADRSTVEKMLPRIAHRGPDDEGIWVSEPGPDGTRAVLGHKRLSIIDLSPAGHQPMTDASGRLWLTFNGEIYNYRELREQLRARGHRFVSNTDSEVILYAYTPIASGAPSACRASTVCSPSPSGTASAASSSPRATGSARSPSTGR
jgi:asparagine synthase (glutamine-hydrolysing)